MKFQYLTFDCYGTLIDWKKGIEAHLGELLRKNGVVPKKKIFPIYVKFEAEEFAESVPYWTPFSDTTETLKELGRRGYKRVILSNVDRDLLRETILRNGLEVDGFITAEDVGSYKPAVGHWNAFLERYKASKESTLHIAQSLYHDVLPATKLGFDVAWINRYGEGNGGLSPNYAFNDLKSLLTILR